MYVFLKFVFLFFALGVFENAIATCVVKHSNTKSLTPTNNTLGGIRQLLRDGLPFIELDENDRDMVVFLGLSGSGKTTLAVYIAGDEEDLISTETKPGSKRYKPEDKCDRTSSASTTLDSITLVPNRFVDAKTNVTFFDMPGFSDTRPQVAYDIATMYFTKKVLNYAKRVKLVFVVDYSHVKAGGDRARFTELVEHATRLVRNVSKFENSIALVASKVENIYDSARPVEFPYIPDDVVIAEIGNFLMSAKNTYLNQTNRTEAVKLVDILLHNTTSVNFDRIGLFRQPDGAGPLNEVRSLKGSKDKLKALIDHNIVFTEKDEADFGCIPSEKTRNTLHDMKLTRAELHALILNPE